LPKKGRGEYVGIWMKAFLVLLLCSGWCFGQEISGGVPLAELPVLRLMRDLAKDPDLQVREMAERLLKMGAEKAAAEGGGRNG